MFVDWDVWDEIFQGAEGSIWISILCLKVLFKDKEVVAVNGLVQLYSILWLLFKPRWPLLSFYDCFLER